MTATRSSRSTRCASALPRIDFKASVLRDLRRVDRAIADRILSRIQRELTAAELRPQALHGEFAGLFKLRIGEYRVIYSRTADGFLVLRVGHRSDVYR